MIEMLSVCACIMFVSGYVGNLYKDLKDSALRANCANNLSQCGTALSQYARDYYGFFPLFTNEKGLGDLSNWRDLYFFTDPLSYHFSTASIPPYNIRQGNMTLDPRLPRLLTEYTAGVEVMCCPSQGNSSYWKNIGPFFYNATIPFRDPSQKRWQAVAQKDQSQPLAGCQNPGFAHNFYDRSWRHGSKKDSEEGYCNLLYPDGRVQEKRHPISWSGK